MAFKSQVKALVSVFTIFVASKGYFLLRLLPVSHFRKTMHF